MTELANLPFTWPGAGADIVEMAKRMTELAPKYLAAEHTGLHILFMSMANPVVLYSKNADPQARRLQGHEDSLRLDHQQGNARRARARRRC